MKLFKSLSCILVVLFLFSTVNVWAEVELKDAFSDFSLANFIQGDAKNDQAVADAIAANAIVGSLATTDSFTGSTPKPWNGVIGYIKNGSYIGYKSINFGTEPVNVTAYMKVDKNHDNGYATGSYIEIRLDNKESAAVARIDLPDKEVWDAKGLDDALVDETTWKFNVLTPIEVTSTSPFEISGVHDVYFVFLNSNVKIQDLPNAAPDQNPFYCNISEAYFKKVVVETTAPVDVTAAPTTAIPRLTNSITQNPGGGISTPVIIGICAVVVIVAAAAVILIVKSKNKNNGGEK